MRKSLKYIYYVAGCIICIGMLLLAVKKISDGRYTSQLPVLPHTENLSVSLREQIGEAYKKTRRNPSSMNLGKLGMVFHSGTLYEEASACYSLALRKNCSKWIWNYYLGLLGREMGDNTAIIKNFTSVVEKQHENYLAWYYIGEAYQSMGSNDEARNIFDKIVLKDNSDNSSGNSTRKDFFPLSTYAMFQIANIWMNTQHADLAEKTLKELIKDQPCFGQAYRLLGNIFYMGGNEVLSRNFVTRAGDLRIYTPPVDIYADVLALMTRSESYLLKAVDDAEKGGYSDFALELVSAGMSNIPGDKFVMSKAVKLYLQRGLDKLALPCIDKNLENFRDDINELRMIADLCTKRRLFTNALTYYTRASELLRDDIDIKLSIVLCQANEGMKELAMEEMNKLLESYKGNVKVASYRVYLMILLGEKDKAQSLLDELMKNYPSEPTVLQLAGQEMEQEGNFEKALEFYESSFVKDPADWTTARSLGDLLMKMKKWDRSITHYQNTLVHFPNEPYALERLGTLLALCPDTTLRNIRTGMEYSERAFLNKSSQPVTVISAGRCLAECYATLGDFRNACKYMETIIDMARQESVPKTILDELERNLQIYRKKV